MDVRSPTKPQWWRGKYWVPNTVQRMAGRHVLINGCSGQAMAWSSTTGNNVSPHIQ